MKLIRHAVAGIAIFGVLMILCSTIFTGFQKDYGIEKNATVNGDNFVDKINDLALLNAMNETVTAFYDIKEPTGTQFDTLGALASAGLGVVKIAFGILLFPFQILNILMMYYGIPPVIITGILTLMVIYIGFILISAYTRGDL